jgi:aryl-alcohol dehydrogenase-like predicted oxidoreductase/HEAT repeat protein
VSVRLAALKSLENRAAFVLAPVVSRLLDRDGSWLIRRAALEFLAHSKAESRWQVLKAATDPHWRVRHALIQVLLGWIQSEEDRECIIGRLKECGNDARTTGIIRYLRFRLSGQWQGSQIIDAEDPQSWCEFWDWDPAVLAYRLEQMPPTKRREAVSIMPHLIGHEDERVRRFAALTLRQVGQADELLKTLVWLDDPRHQAYQTVFELMGKLDLERTEAVVRGVFDQESPTPGQWVWALGQIDRSVPAEDLPQLPQIRERAFADVPSVRAALARTVARANIPERNWLLMTLLEDSHPDVVLAALEGIADRSPAETRPVDPGVDCARFLDSDDPEIRAAAAACVLKQDSASDFIPQLVADPFSAMRVLAATWLIQQDRIAPSEWIERCERDECSLVRAAALTSARAEELNQDPARETSWFVLEQAARLGKTPFWKIALEESAPKDLAMGETPAMLSMSKPSGVVLRTLGDWQVCPLGLSGHYGLPVEGFARAIEAGVNLMFWEPNYHTLTNFMARVEAHDRRQVHMVAGTFEADPSRIRKDVDRALEKLGIERIAVFLLFWTRSWSRITDHVREMLDQLRQQGKIGTYGLSTHLRPLAVEAIDAGWNPVMVRHSAAHRGAESLIFPKAQERGTQLLTFNNTCYGRLLEALPSNQGLTAADCYRYTLSFDAVTACWSAPRTLEELETNLEVLRSPELPPERRELLLEAGQRVYEEDAIFRQLVRGV